jgi:homoserine dehydrogenase
MVEVNVGLAGFGTIGSGLVKLLNQNSVEISKKTGIKIYLKKIVDKNIERKRSIDVGKELLSTDIDSILDDGTIDVFVELIGGCSPAKEFILKALRNGKRVVTANKELLAKSRKELFDSSPIAGKRIFFEASVGGGIPVISALKNSLLANKISRIEGILNGTSNFMLSRMEKDRLSFADALRLAQEKGFAEANPSNDIDGTDVLYKMIILSWLAFGADVRREDCSVEGISKVGLSEIQTAFSEGARIRLVGEAKSENGKVIVNIAPKKFPLPHHFSMIEDEYNAIRITGDFVGDLLFVGKGAGMNATASAVASDIIEAAKQVISERSNFNEDC